MKRPANYTRPMLTPEHFTPENALKTFTLGGHSASGLCTPDAPWGGQCTRYLKDGTPVDSAFAIALLRHLTGETDARRDYIRKWSARIERICAETKAYSARDPFIAIVSNVITS